MNERRLVECKEWKPVAFVLILVLVRSLYNPKSTRPDRCCCFCSCQRMHISLPSCSLHTHTHTQVIEPPPHTHTQTHIHIHNPQHGLDHEQGLVNFSSRKNNIHGNIGRPNVFTTSNITFLTTFNDT